MWQHSRPAGPKTAIGIAALVGLLCGLLPASALATNYAWSGGGTVSADAWSNTANWKGSAAPSGAVGTLTFPALTSAACTAEPPSAACYTSSNDVSSLSVNGISIADNAPYTIEGDGITLGAGGITGSASGSYTGPPSVARLNVPLTLDAPQTWSLSGGNPFSNFAIGGPVSGSSSDTLGIVLSNSVLDLDSNMEVGATEVTGKGYVDLGFRSTPGSVNASDDSPVSFGTEPIVQGEGISIATGPLTAAGTIYLGEVDTLGESSTASTLTVHGGVTLESTTSFDPTINYPGTVAGTDYSQLTASGNVNLGGARLELLDGESFGEVRECDEMTPGDVDTIVTTSGTLTGTFSGVPDGTTVPVSCGGEAGTAPTAQINYTAHAVTATIETAGSGSALAADYTWSGDGTSSSWSEGANWLGDVAPSNGASIETLSFPVRPAATSSKSDVTGLSVNALRVDDSHGYGIGGEPFTLGSGGLSVSASEGHEANLVLSTPITLSGDQTWAISGPPERLGAGVVGQDVGFYGVLAGESSNLTINLSGEMALVLGIDVPEAPVLDDELSTITINGEEEGNDLVIAAAKLNASDGHSLMLHHVHYEGSTATGPIVANEAALTLSGDSIGPVTATSSRIYPEGSLSLPSLSLDAASTLGLEITAQGSVAGTDYDQLTSTGSISLGGAQLQLSKPYAGEGCALPSPVGQVYTLVSTSGSLSGTFGNTPNGSTLVAYCFAAELFGGVNRAYPYRVNYNTGGSTKTVTATALPVVPLAYAEEPQPPAIGGSAVEGQNLTLTHGGWANNPSSYSDQWERCNGAGETCASIAGATGPTYMLTSADVGSTIRVQEIASNSEGSSSPASSNATAVVQVPPPAGGSSGSSSTSTSTNTTTSTGSGGGTSIVATISSAQLAASLGAQLAPSGKAATIGALLKHGGLAMPFTALEAGTLVVQWYEVPAGAKLAKHSAPKPVLVASGQMTFSGAGTAKVKIRLTAAGKRLLERAKRVKLTTKARFTPKFGASIRSSTQLVVKQ